MSTRYERKLGLIIFLITANLKKCYFKKITHLDNMNIHENLTFAHRKFQRLEIKKNFLKLAINEIKKKKKEKKRRAQNEFHYP